MLELFPASAVKVMVIAAGLIAPYVRVCTPCGSGVVSPLPRAIVNLSATTVTVKLCVGLFGGLLESVACTVKV
jgi:hypothetical protein